MTRHSGLIRQVDKLGRVSIPSEIRKSLNLNDKCLVEFSIVGNQVVFEKYNTVCFICGDDRDIDEIIISSKRGPKRVNICRFCKNCLIEEGYSETTESSIKLEELI